MEIKILRKKENLKDLEEFARFWYPGFLKGTVDIKNKKVAIGGEWHIESLELLVGEGSSKDDVWGFNVLFPSGEVEYHSMVNIKPSKNHKTMVIVDEDLQQEMLSVIQQFVEFA